MYHIVENAGQTNEHTVQTFPDWIAAHKHVDKTYSFREQESLRVDIMLEDADGNLTTEY